MITKVYVAGNQSVPVALGTERRREERRSVQCFNVERELVTSKHTHIIRQCFSAVCREMMQKTASVSLEPNKC